LTILGMMDPFADNMRFGSNALPDGPWRRHPVGTLDTI
jgi:hypothetical protein